MRIGKRHSAIRARVGPCQRRVAAGGRPLRHAQNGDNVHEDHIAELSGNRTASAGLHVENAMASNPPQALRLTLAYEGAQIRITHSERVAMIFMLTGAAGPGFT